MKKSTLKDLKLKLNRETLRNLEQPTLEIVAGGATAGPSVCVGSCGCNTRTTCTSNLC
jgi:hypothetical protein